MTTLLTSYPDQDGFILYLEETTKKKKEYLTVLDIGIDMWVACGLRFASSGPSGVVPAQLSSTMSYTIRCSTRAPSVTSGFTVITSMNINPLQQDLKTYQPVFMTACLSPSHVPDTRHCFVNLRGTHQTALGALPSIVCLAPRLPKLTSISSGSRQTSQQCSVILPFGMSFPMVNDMLTRGRYSSMVFLQPC